MSFGNYFSLLDMYPDVDRWLSTISSNMAGSPLSGFRAARTTFEGSLGSFSASRQAGGKVNASSQASLRPTVELDQTQGGMVATGRDTDYAIQGQGYFLLEDQKGNLYLTRNGEFKVDDLGQLNAGNGLKVVTRARAIEKGLMTPTTMNTVNAVKLINQNGAGWQWAQSKSLAPTITDPVNGGSLQGIWFPYVSGDTNGDGLNDVITAYDESGTSYKEQVVAFKRTYDLGSSINPTAANSYIEARADDWTHVYINGTRLTRADAIDWNNRIGTDPTVELPDASGYNQGGPISGAQFGAYIRWDISQYLRPGQNTITMYSSEVRDYEGVNLNGRINGQTVSTFGGEATKWLSRIIGTNQAGTDDATPEALPTDERLDRTFERGIDDLAIVNFPEPSQLKYSRYGTNYLEITPEAGAISYEFSSPDIRNAKVRRGYVEKGNTSIQLETSELAMAQRMYKAVTGLANLQLKAFQRQIDLIQ
jgi:flagellar hook-basal body protein